jgi:hypothetical protein
MEVVVWIGAVASVVAAIGVVWERVHWWRTRPCSDVRVKVLDRAPKHIAQILHEREWAASLKNWGTEVALGVELIGYNCELTFDRDKAVRLDPQAQVRFSVDVEPENIDTAWISVHWSTPTARNRNPAAWFPVSEFGVLAEVYRRQVGMSALRRFVARKTLTAIPTPVSIAIGSTPRFPMNEPVESVLSSSPPRRWRVWWRRPVAKLFRVEVDPRAWAAMDVIEDKLMEHLSQPPAQPGDGQPEPVDEVERMQTSLDQMIEGINRPIRQVSEDLDRRMRQVSEDLGRRMRQSGMWSMPGDRRP